MKTRKILPTTILLISILMMVTLHFLLPVVNIIQSPYHLIGIIPLVSGVIINIAADHAFRQVNTMVKPFQESSALIVYGAFQISRNPMYLGFVFILLGTAILVGSLSPFLVIPGFMVWIEKMYILEEEKMLSAKFGEVYEGYKLITRRWL